MSRAARKPELMSPAGGEAQLFAAVEAGADAVYFGLQGFNARQKAMAFTHENLDEVVAYLHERGVMGFVAVNTLVFDDELSRLEREIEGIAASGADAVIVQDIGAVKLIHEIAPELPIHASTQMTITSAEGAALARGLGVSRAVLARELSLKDIERIANATDLELETFVHGALCVSYSGQCFSSEAWGGRSANRGACAQACRMPYELLVDGAKRDLGEYRYLLSPQDLYALEQVPELMRIGVDCLKIEGRYKDAEYVAATTAAYREAIDAAWNAADLPSSTLRETKFALEGVYSRGLLPAFMQGTNHQQVVQGRAPRHRGTRVGTVVEFSDRGVWVRLEGEFARGGVGVLKPGDGLVFDAAAWRSPEEREEGGQVYELFGARGRALVRLEDSYDQREVELRFANRQIDRRRVRVGDWVWRSNDPALERAYREYTDAGDPVTRKPVTWQVHGEIGQPLQLTLTDEQARAVSVQTDEVLQPAQRRALDRRTLEVELGKLGDTPFYPDALEVTLSDGAFLPLSSLGRARREATERLLEVRRTPPPRAIHEGKLEALQSIGARQASPSSTPPSLSVLIRKPDQLEAAIEARPDEIVLDYLDLYGLRPSVERVLEAGIHAVVASPRILKPAEERIQKFLLSLPVSGILVRSLGLLHTLLETSERPALYGDFSLNAANGLTAQHFLELGLARLAPTHDLNAAQITALAAHTDAAKLEVILHHHLPVFHTEHCVFCRFLSTGTDYTNCGHPCESHDLALRDEKGFAHPVVADVGCRNTVFEARAQTGAAHLRGWLEAGIRQYRLEFVHETETQILATVRAYRQALEGKLSPKQLERDLERTAPQGITQGSFIVPTDDLLALPMV
jgi:U32 family peptidase